MILHQHQWTTSVSAAFDEMPLSHRRDALLAAGEQVGLTIRPHGSRPLFTGYRLHSGRQHDWLLVNLADDPLLTDEDGFPIPAKLLRQLHALQRTGVQIDTLAVAHQIPHGALVAGQPLQRAVVTPPPSGIAVRRADLLDRINQALWTAALAPSVLGWPAALRVLRTRQAQVQIGADPILLGALVERGCAICSGAPASWFSLCHWAYDSEEQS